MHSILVFGGTKKDREQEISRILSAHTSHIPSNHPDIRTLPADKTKKTIGIDEIRGIEKFLNIKPLKLPIKILIINSAQDLTLQAQNALLKTLEEPPQNSKIILELQNSERLLPTIISRCKKINLGAKNLVDETTPEHNEQVKLFIQLLEASKGQRLDFIEQNRQKITDKEYALGLLNIWQSVLRDKMILNITPKSSNILNKQNKSLIEKLGLDNHHTIDLINLADSLKKNIQNTNASTRLALELFLLDCNKSR